MVQTKGFVLDLFAIISSLVHLTTGMQSCKPGLQDGRLIKNETYQGCYHEGQGVLAATVNVTHPYIFPLVRKCYVELWNVNGAVLSAPWEQASESILCPDTSSCSTGLTNQSQYCSSISIAVSKSDAVQIELPYIGVEFNQGSSETITSSKQTCSAASTTETCQWSDNGCHSMCAEQKVLAFYGYKRIRCNYHAAILWHWLSKYDTTLCMEDFVTMSPWAGTGTQIACNGTCDPTNPCQGFAGPPYQQPVLGAPASCFDFSNPINPIKPLANDNHGGKVNIDIWMILLSGAVVLGSIQ